METDTDDKNVPDWLLRDLPYGATKNEQLESAIHNQVKRLARNLGQISNSLRRVMYSSAYNSAYNLAVTYVWPNLHRLAERTPDDLLVFTRDHLPPRAKSRVYRLLANHVEGRVRRKLPRIIRVDAVNEVALPEAADGDWGPQGWFFGSGEGRLQRHPTGGRIQERRGLPKLTSVKDIRKLLGIHSEQQLGFLLWANAATKGKRARPGPYIKFSIPKRDGTKREICAPNDFLRHVQRQLLNKILVKVPVHSAAHGFVPGRSTVTNAAAHAGSELVLKFDLRDFFPTIHFNRVVGLFASLGYAVESSRFAASDRSKRVAATLARLCTFADDPEEYGAGYVPQGAPTSPAISNLICRRLDARLAGLAQSTGGVYTRYADDLTFSFKDEEHTNVGRLRWWVDQICHQEGFLVHQGKFRVIRRSQRQLVTGIVVNDSLRIPRRQRRRFRAILHNCRKNGVESQQRDNPSFRSYLRGFAAYIHMVHPEEGADLLRQVKELLGPEA